MSRDRLSVHFSVDRHNELIDRLVDLIEFSRPVADPVTVSLLKMALLRQVEVLDDMPEIGPGKRAMS